MSIESLDAAAAAWTVLSTAYGREPEAAFVEAMRSADQLADWPYDDPGSLAGVRLLVRSGERASSGVQEEQLAALVEDHRRLFVGPRPLLAAPWESVHRSREGLVFDVETLEVRRFYRRFGLESPLLNKEPDDHVALEASFVATLAVRAIDALEGSRPGEAQQLTAGMTDFAEQHLSRWVPDLILRVEEHARSDYHLGLAALTRGALDQLVGMGATSTAAPPQPGTLAPTPR